MGTVRAKNRKWGFGVKVNGETVYTLTDLDLALQKTESREMYTSYRGVLNVLVQGVGKGAIPYIGNIELTEEEKERLRRVRRIYVGFDRVYVERETGGGMTINLGDVYDREVQYLNEMLGVLRSTIQETERVENRTEVVQKYLKDLLMLYRDIRKVKESTSPGEKKCVLDVIQSQVQMEKLEEVVFVKQWYTVAGNHTLSRRMSELMPVYATNVVKLGNTELKREYEWCKERRGQEIVNVRRIGSVERVEDIKAGNVKDWWLREVVEVKPQLKSEVEKKEDKVDTGCGERLDARVDEIMYKMAKMQKLCDGCRAQTDINLWGSILDGESVLKEIAEEFKYLAGSGRGGLEYEVGVDLGILERVGVEYAKIEILKKLIPRVKKSTREEGVVVEVVKEVENLENVLRAIERVEREVLQSALGLIMSRYGYDPAGLQIAKMYVKPLGQVPMYYSRTTQEGVNRVLIRRGVFKDNWMSDVYSVLNVQQVGVEEEEKERETDRVIIQAFEKYLRI